MCSTTTPAAKIHKFEAAGLGKAPFRFVGIQSADDRAGINREREANGQMFTTNNCTSCDYCSQAIWNAYYLESADGKRFKIGCDCIRKAGDKGLTSIVDREESAKRREKSRQARITKRQQENNLLAAFRSGNHDAALRAMPHPKGRADSTAYDYVLWCADNKFFGATAQKLMRQAMGE